VGVGSTLSRLSLLLIQGGLIGIVLSLLILWNSLDPTPPAWDEAQHLLQAQAFGQQGAQLFQTESLDTWWHTFWLLSQRYPPLTYILGIPFGVGQVFSRAHGQLLNLGLLFLLILATMQIGSYFRSQAVSWLAGSILLLYPAISGLAHVYMTDLPLTVGVTFGYWAALAYWIRPGWKQALALGSSLGIILLIKWNGILFLGFPLVWIILRTFLSRSWIQYLGLIEILGSCLIICWPWYSHNALFVLSNGLNYAETTHYYEKCTAGSWCWWTTYLTLLPEQMSPPLVLLPLLGFLPFFNKESKPDQTQDTVLIMAVGITYLCGYLIYTLIGIKTIRFTVPLLPLLAILSAVGIDFLFTIYPSSQKGTIALLCLAVGWIGHPFTPGVSPFWKSVSLAWQGIHPEMLLVQWMQDHLQPDPGIRHAVGVLPNTEMLSSETLTYLARIHDLPLTFLPLGQTSWPLEEALLLDQHLHAFGDWGVVDPFLKNKQSILDFLEKDPRWGKSTSTQLSQVGTLQVFQSKSNQLQVTFSPNLDSLDSLTAETPVDLLQIQQLRSCEILDPCQAENPLVPVWEFSWLGSNWITILQTAIWLDLFDSQGHLILQQDFSLGEGRLDLRIPKSLTQQTSLIRHRVTLNLDPDLTPGTYTLTIHWQTFSTPIHEKKMPVEIPNTRIPVAKDYLKLAAQSMAQGDLDQLSQRLSIWTTLRFTPILMDPGTAMTKRLLTYRLDQAQLQNDLTQEIQLRYALGLLAVSLMQAKEAQKQVEILASLQPDNPWNYAYIAFLRLLFTHDYHHWQQDLGWLSYPLFTGKDPVCSGIPDQNQICDWLLQKRTSP
jgi:4-amino-4-deoxy-L-arabinose transferase-like glycosyltransferase